MVISFLGNKPASKYRLVLVIAFSMISGVIAMLLQGQTAFAAVFSASTLASFQVLAHQIYSEFIEKKA